MTDSELADQLLLRLNAMTADPAVREDIQRLLETRVSCSEQTANHPTIQTQEGHVFGFLGLLNGILGAIPEGKRQGWGYLAAVFDDDGKLMHFTRTDAV